MGSFSRFMVIIPRDTKVEKGTNTLTKETSSASIQTMVSDCSVPSGSTTTMESEHDNGVLNGVSEEGNSKLSISASDVDGSDGDSTPRAGSTSDGGKFLFPDGANFSATESVKSAASETSSCASSPPDTHSTGVTFDIASSTPSQSAETEHQGPSLKKRHMSAAEGSTDVANYLYAAGLDLEEVEWSKVFSKISYQPYDL